MRAVIQQSSRLFYGPLVSLVCLFLAACSEAPPPAAPVSRVPLDRVLQEDDIREVVFRYRIGNRYVEFSKSPTFLTIDGKDPSDEFMARFAGLQPPVKKGSGAYVKENPFEDPPGDPNKWDRMRGKLRDRSNDERAFSVHVGEISWITPTQVEIWGGTYCGWTCGDAGVFRVVKKDGRWVVEEYEQRMISLGTGDGPDFSQQPDRGCASSQWTLVRQLRRSGEATAEAAGETPSAPRCQQRA